MNRFNNQTARPVYILAVIAIVAALYLARDLLIPVALATFFTFLLYPVVRKLMRWGMNRAVAVVIAVICATGIAAGTGVLVVQQMFDLSSHLPDYRDNLRAKAKSLRRSVTGEVKVFAVPTLSAYFTETNFGFARNAGTAAQSKEVKRKSLGQEKS